MDPVSNANRLALLLRARLQERARTAAASRSNRREEGAAGKAGIAGAESLDGLDDRKLRRAVIENILADQLGDGLVNDANFQQMVDRVTEAIADDSRGAPVLAEVLANLRAKR